MNYYEIHMDLFYFYEKNKYFNLVQCISSDYEMGAGISVDFNKYFNCKNIVRKNCIPYWNKKGRILPLIDLNIPVINLVTKQYYFNKPTYKSLTEALVELKKFVIERDIKYIAMPKIGCGIDKLNWDKVKQIISDIFEDIEITIVVCYK